MRVALSAAALLDNLGMAAGDFDYERHGAGYTEYRRPDPRIAEQVRRALGDSPTVLNVGAGAGSYEPEDRYVVAVEPSARMRSMRPRGAVPAVDAVAERLPFDAGAFAGAMAISTIHQWPDCEPGLRELRRVTRGPVVVLTFDGPALSAFWLAQYAPEMTATEQGRMPDLARVGEWLGGTWAAEVVPIPLDCTDGFTEAYYGRPERFLDPTVRQAQSCWGFVSEAIRRRSIAALAADLRSGAWDARWGALREAPVYEGSLRLLVSRP